MNQSIIDRAVKIATQKALSGNPVERIVWECSQTSADCPKGLFIIIYGKASLDSTRKFP